MRNTKNTHSGTIRDFLFGALCLTVIGFGLAYADKNPRTQAKNAIAEKKLAVIEARLAKQAQQAHRPLPKGVAAIIVPQIK